MKERTGTVNCMIATIIICIIAELIGPLQFKVMGIDVKILTMIWVIIMGILLSPTLLGKVIPPLKKFISKAEIKRAPFLLSLTLYPLGIMFGINAGPKVGIVLQAGPALLFQEAGNMMTMLIALPLGLLLGLGRSAVGGTFSLCRDTALGIIGDEYGLESREGMGTLGTYISGCVFGTLFYSFLAPIVSNRISSLCTCDGIRYGKCIYDECGYCSVDKCSGTYVFRTNSCIFCNQWTFNCSNRCVCGNVFGIAISELVL